MEINEFINLISETDVHNVSLEEILFNNKLEISTENILKKGEKQTQDLVRQISAQHVNQLEKDSIKIYQLFDLINQQDYLKEVKILHPRHIFRIHDNITYHFEIPLVLDYSTQSSYYPTYQSTELNNRILIERACKNTDASSFISFKIEKNHKSDTYLQNKKVYVYGKGYFFYFDPILLLESDFSLIYGEPHISVTMLSSNRFELKVQASKRTSYLRDTDSDIKAIFNLHTFSFEQFDISQDKYNLR